MRNDPAQYEDLADAWWDPRGPFAMLGWLAAARAALVPPATRPDAVLLDLGCGGGLLAPHVAPLGYSHVGVDTSPTALGVAAAHGVRAVRGSVTALPLPDAVADVVVAGEVLEHVADWRAALAEAVRVLRPGGTLVVDTIAAGRLSALVAVGLAERVPGGPPPGLHDPALFVDPTELTRRAAVLGVGLHLRGVRPHLRDYLAWVRGPGDIVRMTASRLPAVLVAGAGTRDDR